MRPIHLCLASLALATTSLFSAAQSSGQAVSSTASEARATRAYQAALHQGPEALQGFWPISPRAPTCMCTFPARCTPKASFAPLAKTACASTRPLSNSLSHPAKPRCSRPPNSLITRSSTIASSTPSPCAASFRLPAGAATTSSSPPSIALEASERSMPANGSTKWRRAPLPRTSNISS